MTDVHVDDWHINYVDAFDVIDAMMLMMQLDVVNSILISVSLVIHCLYLCFLMILQNLEHVLGDRNSMDHLQKRTKIQIKFSNFLNRSDDGGGGNKKSKSETYGAFTETALNLSLHSAIIIVIFICLHLPFYSK